MLAHTLFETNWQNKCGRLPTKKNAVALTLVASGVPEDNVTVCSDRTDAAKVTEGETDEGQEALAARLRLHMDAIAAMGLQLPPLPRPLQESRRSWLRRVRNKHKKRAGKGETALLHLGWGNLGGCTPFQGIGTTSSFLTEDKQRMELWSLGKIFGGFSK